MKRLILIIRSILIVCLGFMALNSYGQGLNIPEDSVLINSSDIQEIFSQVEAQTELKFAYNSSDIQNALAMDSTMEKRWLVEDLLIEISRRTELKFSSIDNYISVRLAQKKK